MPSRVPSEPAGAVTEADDADAGAPADATPAALAPSPPDTQPSQSAVTRRAPRPATPTLWEQGRHPGRLVLRVTTLLLLLALGLNLLATGSLGLPFDMVFIASCVLIALWVHPRDFFMIGVYPPIALGAIVLLLGIVDPAAVARATDPAGQAIVSGLAHQAWPLVFGYALTLGIIALRQVAVRNRGRLRLR